MKSIFITLLLVAGFTSSLATAGPAPKLEICHIPPGNPENYHTINVSENALSAHLAHGDLGGACNALCDQICDDGNACTIDHNDDCETNGCLVDPTIVDCSDGSLCTVDSCDPASGCANTPVTCSDPDLCTNSTCSENTGQCEDSPKVCPDTYTCSLETGTCDPDPEFECETDDDCDPGDTCIQNECIEGSARNLRGPDSGECDGPKVGHTTVVVLEQPNGILVDVEFSNGPPSSNFTVFWVCTELPGGCHGAACGFITLGTISTDVNGQGAFSTVLQSGNPFPNKYVHFDLGGSSNYTSITHDEIFPTRSPRPNAVTSTATSQSAGGRGDPINDQ